jgi:glucosamine-6-phosphate deaminase
MKIIIAKDYEELSKLAADLIKGVIEDGAPHTLGLATGSSPIGTYDNLIKYYQNKEISFKNVTTYNLDEYCGIDRTHPQSYYYFMHDHLFNHVDIKEENTHVPYAAPGSNLKEEAQKYTDELNKVTIDLQLLGIGANGHIGFNEPGTPFSQETFVVTLTDKTRQDNKRFFNSIDEVPTHAMTMGIANIMRAKSILMLISGTNKADTVVKLLKGDVTPDFPASVLQNHPDVTVIIDEAAYSKMN